MDPVRGRFAPSPTGPLHVGNLRTALAAWCHARALGGSFLLRFEDLDRVTASQDHERTQAADLAAIGLDWDEAPVRQSERFDRYTEAEQRLRATGAVYPCFCTRREIAEASEAPHAAPDRYPGTCRGLATRQVAQRQQSGRSPAWRWRASPSPVAANDLLHGEVSGVPDDVVLRRNDGVPAYNLAVVVDDAAQGITDVVRGDDLLAITPSQVALGDALGLPRMRYLHVPLVVGSDGRRLAKRHGAITLADLTTAGDDAEHTRLALAASLGIDVADRPGAAALASRFDIASVPLGVFTWQDRHP
jgi:glutamyl-tRNA synthetase